MKREIVILGATGSIGLQSIEVLEENRNDFNLRAISIGKNINKLKEILDMDIFNIEIVSTKDDQYTEELKNKYPKIEFVYGDEGLLKVCNHIKNGLVINALSGSVGLIPTITAMNNKNDIALANKESLVMAGDIIMKLAKSNKVNIIPVDSEHSAIMQCIEKGNEEKIKKIIITASGGAFRNKSAAELINVKKEDALKHPNWSMGDKITIDSATMMNKGLEIIEAHHLFDINYENIEPIIHYESIIHSMVEYQDGSIISHMGNPSMKIPIRYSLSYPSRMNVPETSLDIAKLKSLTFDKVDLNKYPCLNYAIKSGLEGGLMPVVLNAANEAAVKLFLEDRINYLDIPKIIKKELDNFTNIKEPTLDEIIETNNYIQKKILELRKGD